MIKTRKCQLCGKRISKKFLICPKGCSVTIKKISVTNYPYNPTTKILKDVEKSIHKIGRFKY